MSPPVTPKIPFGADHNPQQWPEPVWDQDYRLFDAAGIDDEIEPPSALTEHWRGPDHTAFQGITLDYRRFMSEAMLANFLDEKAAIRRWSPDVPVTTNFMGVYQPIDYHRWAPHLDFASWDNYPPDDVSHVRMALTHDLMRGLKDGQPFWVMEQTPSTTASRDVNPLKRPGVMRLWSWQAVAHGADALLFFQLRASRGACGKYHGAVIGHAGRGDTRVFREVAELGADVQDLETAVRVGPDGIRTLFLLNHRSESVEVVAERGGTDPLSGLRVAVGDVVKIEARGVTVLREGA